MPPFGRAYFTKVIGNPRGSCFSCLGNTFGQANLLKPFVPFVASYMLWQSFAKTTWHILLFRLVGIISKDKEKIF